MRLLQIHENGGFSLIERFGDDIPPYAILSHTWGSPDEEVSFQDMQAGSGENKRGYRKLLFCGKQAANDGLGFFWMDTCCIDKTSSAELSEAINSMYMWYGAAEICYAYLADVHSIGDLPNSRWFTRGWTLQELIAPTEVVFYDEEWERLGTRLQLSESIQECTGIPEKALLESRSLDSFSVAQKMSWAANRNTTRVEDRAYSLIGIFGINMPLIYGEGENAFIRLQEEVMKIYEDHSLFAWTSQDGRGGCLATSPFAFRACANVVQTDHLDTFYDPPVVSSRGVQIELRFMGCRPGWRGLAILNCCEEGSTDKPFAIYVQDLSRSMKRFERIHGDALTIPVRTIDPSLYSVKKLYIRTGRPDGKKVDQRTFDSLPPQAMDWQSESRDFLVTPHWDTIAPPLESVFHTLSSGKEDEMWLLLTRPGVRVNMQDHDGRTALSHAASKGYEVAVRMLLARSDIEVNLADNVGATPLGYAAVAGKTATVTLLLDDIRTERDKKDSAERTPLSLAAAWGQHAVVRLLLQTGNAQVDVCDREGRTPLWWALGERRTSDLPIRSRYNSTIRLLLEFGACTDKRHDNDTMLVREAGYPEDEEMALLLIAHGADVNGRDANDEAPLHSASRAGNLKTVQALLNKGANIQARAKDQETPLHTASRYGNADVVSVLLERGVDVDIQARTKDQETPLHTASRCGNADVVSVLLERGADIQACTEDGKTPLHTSSRYGNADVVSLLLKRGADFQARDTWMCTPLHEASRCGNADVVSALLKRGADIQARARDQETPLHTASRSGNTDVVSLLLERGADIQARGIDDTPLYTAAVNGKADAAFVLLERGADVKAKNSFGRTALAGAIYAKHEELVQKLIDYGADVNEIMQDGLTPLMYAIDHGNSRIMQVLEENGARVEEESTLVLRLI